MKTRRFAFTLVEVLVVIIIIGLLVAIAVPTVNSVRRTARQTECLDRMRQLGRAIQSYEGSKNHYPGWRDTARRIAGPGQGTLQLSWCLLLLPELDRRDVFDSFVRPARLPSGGYAAPQARKIDVLVCPADPEKRDAPDTQPLLSYVVNAGMPDQPNTGLDYKANGIFHDLVRQPSLKMTSRYIAQGDGLALTLLLSENLAAGRYPQAQAEFLTTMVFLANPSAESRINGSENRTPAYPRARPSSVHLEGVNVVFANGNGRFLSDKIDYAVYRELMTTRKDKARDPTTNAPVPPLPRKLTTTDLDL